MSGAPVLSVRALTRHYATGAGLVRALDGVSLEVAAGELIGIFGPSGSGKSTFLMLAGLLENPTSGEVWLAGERVSHAGADLDALREIRRKRIGFVFQKARSDPLPVRGGECRARPRDRRCEPARRPRPCPPAARRT
ncbi:ATP-binding cassette domain-containing protein [Ancylobacter dichloromethanicus]